MKTTKQTLALVLSMALCPVTAAVAQALDASSYPQMMTASAMTYEASMAKVDEHLKEVFGLKTELMKFSNTESKADTKVEVVKNTSLPSKHELEQRQVNLEEFIKLTDAINLSFHRAVVNYRDFLISLKELKGSCEEDTDLKGDDSKIFNDLIKRSKKQCAKDIERMDAEAKKYAIKIDEAKVFIDLLARVSVKVLDHIDRLKFSLDARQLKNTIDKGILEMENSRDSSS